MGYSLPKAQALSTVSLLYEGEPPPPISSIQAMRLPLDAGNLFGMHIFHQLPSLLVLTSPTQEGMEGWVNPWSAAQLGLVTYHAMEQCQ